MNYKAPELLLGNGQYDFSIDMWSFGCMFAQVILKKNPIFTGRDIVDQLTKISKILGHSDLFEFIADKKIEFPEIDVLKSTIGKHPKKPWEKMIDSKNEKLATEEALDLISHLLVYNPDKRFTAKEAKEHAFFSGLY
jgi:casein kinase II subunit alpha